MADAIARRLGRARDDVARSIARLIDRGLLTVPGSFAAAPEPVLAR
jgi:hypothetical protein